MESRNFKKILSASIASLTVLSTLSSSVSTKIYATKPEVLKNVNNNPQKVFIACSYKGYNIMFRYNMSFLNKPNIKLVNQFAKKFREITINCPFDKKIPKEKLVFYDIENTQIDFEMMREFLFIANPKKQKKYVEKCLESALEEYLNAKKSIEDNTPIVDYSYIESALKKIDKEQKEAKKDNEPAAYDFMGTICSDISDDDDAQSFEESDYDDTLSDDDEIMQCEEVYSIKYSYKKRTFIIGYPTSSKGLVEKRVLVQFVEKLKKIFKSSLFDERISKKVIFNTMLEKALSKPEIMKKFLSIESLRDQKKFIETFLTDKYKLITLEYDEPNADEITSFYYLNPSESSGSY